jgi:CHAT domain-containing protein/tetratricopeptide (TPR) repeat protein
LADLPADRFPSLRSYHLLDLAQALQGDPRRLDEVIDLLHQAITLLDHPVAAEIRATALVSLGSAYRARSSSSGADETEHALVAFRSALATFRRRSYPQQWASTMVNLANTYWERRSQDRLRNLRRAIARHTAALTVFTRDGDPTAWARTMANLGLAQSDPALVQDSDMLETARRNLHGALEVAGLPDDLAAAAWTNLNLCYSRRLTGDPDENAEAALRCARQAYELYRGLGSSLDMAEAAAAVGAALGNRAVREGRPDLDEPVRWYEHALALVSPRDAPLKWAYLADNLATSLAQRGRDDLDDLGRAVDLHRAALLAYEDVDDPYEQARTRYNLAATLLRRADSNLEEIVRLFEHSLRDRPVDAVPLEWAESATELARVRLAVAQSDPVAIALLERVVDVVSPLAAHDHARRAWSLLGAAFADSSRWPDAARAYREAVAAAERLYLLVRLPGGKDAELVQAADIPRLAAYATARAADPTGAAAILERNRARSLGERLDRDSVRLTDLGVVPEYAARGYTAAVARIRTLEATLRQQGVSRAASGTRQLRAAMIDAQVQRDAAVAAIRGQHGFEDFLAVPIEAVLARACACGTPLVYLVITPFGSVALLVRGESEPVTVEAIFSPLTETDLLAALGSRDGEPEYPENTRALVEVLDVLGRGVVGAVAARLRELEASAAVLVPTGLLGILPLHAARYSVADRAVYFQDEFDLSYAPSARVLSAARARTGTTTAQTIGRFVGVAEPVPSDPPLPWATTEVAAIRPLVDGQVDVLAGPSATVTELRCSLPGTTHLHLACHATYNIDEPLASSVFLAGGTQLTLRDLLDEQLLAGVRLVVASACETAVTDMTRLPDEAIGLAAGLVESGATTVIGSLWSVGDRSTALIMARFYRNQLQGDPATGEPPMPPARALARAQAWLRDATRQEIRAFAAAAGLSRSIPEVTRRPGTSNLPGLTPYAGSPFHWAPFIMIGA